MKINPRIWTSLALALFVLALGARAAHAQETVNGTWTATFGDKYADRQFGRKLSEKSGEDVDERDWEKSDGKRDGLHLSLERRTERGGRNEMGQTYDFSELQGLTREQAQGSGPVKFALVREAGRVDLEGSFQNGRGSGTFTFTPDRGFVSAMKGRGFDFAKKESWDEHGEPEDRVFAAAVLNVTTALADDLLSADFGQLDVNDLFKAAIFKIDSKFMREMKASGFPGLRMEELVKARIFKIDADFVREAARLGFTNEPFESLVKMRIFKVTPAFVAEVRGEGLNDLHVEDLVKMRIFNIDADFIRRARAEGIPLEVDALVQERIGVGRHKRTQ
ncbi:MAG: hypothetical protein JOZ02_21005 [Acidobacteria bacterium]|nr:hypothetical protein [Acidobacteriota bacterium]